MKNTRLLKIGALFAGYLLLSIIALTGVSFILADKIAGDIGPVGRMVWTVLFTISGNLSAVGVPDSAYFYVFFLLTELPAILAAFAIVYFVTRKWFSFKEQGLSALAVAIILLVVAAINSGRSLGDSHGQFTGMFSVMQPIQEVRCQAMPSGTAIAWSIPEKDSKASIHTPIVIRQADGATDLSCSGAYADGTDIGAASGLVPANSGNSSIVMVPSVLLTVTVNPDDSIFMPTGMPAEFEELQKLGSMTKEQAGAFLSAGAWKPNQKITLTCRYVRNNCSGTESFSFTTTAE